MVQPALVVAIAFGLSAAIAVSVVSGCHGILWLFRNREAPKPRLLVVSAAWLICGLGVAGYYVFVLRKPSGWFLAIVMSATLTLFQLLAIGIPVSVLSFLVGGPE